PVNSRKLRVIRQSRVVVQMLKYHALFDETGQPVEETIMILSVFTLQRKLVTISRGDERNAAGREDAAHLVEAFGRRNDMFQHAVAKDHVLRPVCQRDSFGSAFDDLLGSA